MPLCFHAGFCILHAMPETGNPAPTPAPAPPGRRKIRLTKSEAYAMGLSAPRKKGLAFGLIALLVAAVLGNVLWHFQDLWLPFWLPEEPAAPEAAMPAAPPEPAAPAADTPAAAALTPAPAALEYLSAAVWDHPQFQQGVKMFNLALDDCRQFQQAPASLTPLIRAEQGALQAAQVFAALRPDAPAGVPIGDCEARSQQLLARIRTLAKAAAPAPAAAAPAAPVMPDIDPQVMKQDPGYLAGARLFNQAVENFKLYQANPARKDLLDPTEEAARQAAETLEDLKMRMPGNVHAELDRQIHQCYGLVSACRGQRLEKEGTGETGKPFERGTAGPSRRPALPAYQPAAPPAATNRP